MAQTRWDDAGAIAATAGGGTAGAMLRERRLAHGLGVDQIGETLRIRPSFIDAIEQNRIDQLPGLPYALGFVRSYADFLGLDQHEVVTRFKKDVSGEGVKTPLSFPTMAPKGGRAPGAGALGFAVVVAASLFGAWYYFGQERAIEPPAIPPLPERLAAPTPPAAPAADAADHQAAAPTNPAPASPPGSSSVAAAEPAPGETTPSASSAAPTGLTTTPAVTVAAPPAETASPPPATAVAPSANATQAPSPTPTPGGFVGLPPAATGAIYGNKDADARIALTAEGDESWVQVRDQGRPIFTRTLKPGETLRIWNRPGLTLTAGNAGSLLVTVDGQPGPRLGKRKVIRRDILLDADQLKAGLVQTKTRPATDGAYSPPSPAAPAPASSPGAAGTEPTE